MLATFVKYNKRWTFQAIFFLLICAYRFCFKHSLAKACGAILYFPIIPAIIVPLLRVLYTNIRHSYIGRWLGLDHRLVDHRIYAYGACAVMAIHSVAHVIHDTWTPHTLLTGIIMIGALIAMVLVFHVFVGKSYSLYVLRPHQCFAILFLIVYAMHTPDLLYWSLAIITIYAWDLFCQNFDYSYYTIIVCAKRIAASKYMYIQIKRPKHFVESLPGQYAMLSFPAIERVYDRSHPFTIAKIDNNYIWFIVKAAGPWTEKLISLHHSCAYLPIVISGPYGSSIPKETNAIVVSGSGLTPAIAYMTCEPFVHTTIHILGKEAAEIVKWAITKFNLNQSIMIAVKYHQRTLDLANIINDKMTCIYTCGGVSNKVYVKALEYDIPCFTESH